MKKQHTWKVTINYVPFESEAQRERHFMEVDKWVDRYLQGKIYEFATHQRKQREGNQQDEPFFS